LGSGADRTSAIGRSFVRLRTKERRLISFDIKPLGMESTGMLQDPDLLLSVLLPQLEECRTDRLRQETALEPGMRDLDAC
jgi:hypothetical protein